MLTITHWLKKKEIIRTLEKKGQSEPAFRKSIPASKEWINSLYAFRQNSTRFLPAIHNYVFKYLKGYFNMVNKNIEPEMVTRKSSIIRRSTGRKIWISTPEIKHTSEKIYITIYVYNRLYNAYRNNLDLLQSNWGVMLEGKKKSSVSNLITIKPNKIINVKPLTSNIKTNILNKRTNINSALPKTTNSNMSIDFNKQFSTLNQKGNREINKTIKGTAKLTVLRRKYPTYLGKTSSNIITDSKNHYMNVIKWLKVDKLEKIQEYKANLNDFLNNNNNNSDFNNEFSLLKMERYDYLVNCFKKELTYLKLRQKLLFTQFKLSEIYLTPIINFLATIYGKKIVFNIVTLKTYHLSTSILLQIIVAKLKKESSRGRPLKVIDTAYSGIKTPNLSANKLQKLEKRYVSLQNIILTNKVEKQDSVEKFLLNNNIQSDKNIHKLVLKNLENKSVAGLFMKISGRLTKRYKAQRAITTLRSRGSLKNVYSSYTGLSSVLSRGFINLNVEKTMIHSKNRIGAYGLTGWMANH